MWWWMCGLLKASGLQLEPRDHLDVLLELGGGDYGYAQLEAGGGYHIKVQHKGTTGARGFPERTA